MVSKKRALNFAEKRICIFFNWKSKRQIGFWYRKLLVFSQLRFCTNSNRTQPYHAFNCSLGVCHV